jgi:hypothetical protein
VQVRFPSPPIFSRVTASDGISEVPIRANLYILNTLKHFRCSNKSHEAAKHPIQNLVGPEETKLRTVRTGH